VASAVAGGTGESGGKGSGFGMKVVATT
jgi:hypothetical protein